MLGRRSQRDFEDEIRSHLQMEIDRLLAQGMSAAEAERAARRRFGNVGVAEDRFYHGQRFAWLENGVRDLRRAWRSLLRTPGFFGAAVMTLALGIGAVAGMFDVVNTVLLRPLPYPNPDRLVFVQGIAPGTDRREQFDPGSEFYIHFKENSKLAAGMFTFGSGTSTFRTDDRVERIEMTWLSNDIFTTLGVRPQLGRLPVAADNDHVVVISDELWRTWFGRNPSVVGKSYFVSDSMKQIVGVMPPDFHFPSDKALLWISGDLRPTDVRAGGFGAPIVARLKDGVTPEQLESELTGLAKALPARFGGSPAYARLASSFRAKTLPMLDGTLGPPTVKASLWILLGAVTLVLIIACANVANLFLVRAESRRRDLTVRRAIGASRAQLVRLQMAEAFAVALTAGVLAVILAAIALPLFLRAAPDGIPRLAAVHLDLTTLAAAFGIVMIVALACGAAPALRASSPDLSALREGGRGSTGGRAWGRNLLVVGQTALALVLLIGSALLVDSFRRLKHVDPGYDVKDVYTFQFAPDQPGLRDGPSLGRMHLAFMDRLRALPGVTTVGVVNNIPLDEGTNPIPVRTEDMAGDAEPVVVNFNFAGGDVFKALRVPLLQGRVFTNEEAITPNNSVIISRSAAAKLWPGQNPLGRRLRPRFGGDDTLSFNVVGVVGDVKQYDWRQPGEAALYFALTGPTATSWGVGSPAYVVKGPRAAFLKSQVRSLVKEIAPEAPVYREYTMEFLARRSMIQLSFTMLTLGVVSALALVLGLVGLYGVLSYVIAQRTREIGVRMALGATAAAVRMQVVTQGARVVFVGVIIGMAAAIASTRMLGTLLFGVKAADPLVFAAMALTMIGMGVLASYLPARRASNVDPVEALRSD
jgi:putative ABC transport system permease protein